MEPVTSTVLQALAAGAQAAATGIATDEIKRSYNGLKTLIQQKWAVKPPAEKLLSEYEKDPDSWEQVLAEKLEQSDIHQDKRIYQQAEQLLQKLNILVDLSRQASSGHTATTRATVSADTISSGRDTNKAGRDINQNKIYNSQTRIAVLLGLLTLVLAGIIVYLVRTGRISLSNTSLPSPSPSSSSKPPSNSSTQIRTDPNTSLNDVLDIQSRLVSREDLQIEGVVKNIGKTEIKEFAVVVKMSEMTIEPVDLSRSKLVIVITRMRSLQPGESRRIFGKPEVGWVEDCPEIYKGVKNIKYTMYMKKSFNYEVRAIDKDSIPDTPCVLRT